MSGDHGPAFFQTRMGRKFYEADMPRLVTAIERLSERVLELTTAIEEREPTDTPRTFPYVRDCTCKGSDASPCPVHPVEV